MKRSNKKCVKHKDMMAVREAIVKAMNDGVTVESLTSFIESMNKEFVQINPNISKVFGTLKVTHKCYSDFCIEDMLNGWGVHFYEEVTLPGINSIDEFTEGILKVALSEVVSLRENYLAQAQSYAAKY